MSSHPQETHTEGVMLAMIKEKAFKHKLCCKIECLLLTCF